MNVTTDRRAWLDVMLEIKQNFEDGAKMPSVAICHSVLEKLEEDYFDYDDEVHPFVEFLQKESQNWDEFSGSVTWPVKFLAIEDHNNFYWSGEYGQARYRLLCFLINILEKELENVQPS